MRPLQDLYTMQYDSRLEEDRPIDHSISAYRALESIEVLFVTLTNLGLKSTIGLWGISHISPIKKLYYNTLTNVWSKHEKDRGVL